MRRFAYWFAIASTVIASAYLLFGPVYAGRGESLWDVNGIRALVAVSIPLVLVVAPLFMKNPYYQRHAGIGAGILMFGIVLLGLFSIGLYYLPAAVALMLAWTGKRETDEVASGPAAG